MNISLPSELNRDVEKAVKDGKFATKSEFFRHLLRNWKEEEALRGLRQSQRAIANGKGKTLKSLKDLR